MLAKLLDKNQIAENIRQTICEYYPATAHWWGHSSVGAWPPWNAGRFRTQFMRWRTLSAAATGAADPEVRFWDRFCRLAMRRIAAGAWRLPQAPLTHLRGRIVAAGVEALAEGQLPETAFAWEEAARWLDGIDLGSAAGSNGPALTNWEASRIVQEVRRFFGEPRAARPLLRAVVRYRQRARWDHEIPEPLLPTLAVATNPLEWRRRRLMMKPPETTPAARRAGSTWQDMTIFPKTIRERVVLELGNGAWLWPSPNPVILRGPDAEFARARAHVWAWWREQSVDSHPMTWWLGDPGKIDGTLLFLLQCAVRRQPASSLAAIRQGLARQQDLALADAWLWLEGAEPANVTQWLTAWVGRTQAPAAVGQLLLSPGCVMRSELERQRLEQLLSDDAARALQWTGWREGPLDWDLLS